MPPSYISGFDPNGQFSDWNYSTVGGGMPGMTDLAGIGLPSASPDGFQGYDALPTMGQLDTTPNYSQFGNWAQRQGLGFNLGTLDGGLKALSSIGGLYMGMQQLGLAKKALHAQTAFANANLQNQTQSYNTQIADRAGSRAAAVGQTASSPEALAYIANNSLKARTV